MITRIVNATVLDLAADQTTLEPDRQVVIEDEAIVAVERSGTAPSAEERVFDAGGRVLMPGLIDGHVHVTAWNADLLAGAEVAPSYAAIRSAGLMRAMLDRGFTTVRDTGGADFGLARAIDEHRIPGPRLIFGGKALSQTGGHGDARSAGRQAALDDCCNALGQVADGVDEVYRTARNEIRRGAQHIKIMLGGGVASPTDKVSDLQYSPEEISAAVRVASNAGKYVAGHAYTTEAVRLGLELGVRSIEHGNLMDPSVFELFEQHDAYYVPTLSAYDAMAAAGAEVGLSAENLEKNQIVVEAGLRTLEAADRAGLKIVLGTDLLGSLQVHQSKEFLLRREVQSAEAILRSATTVAAELIGQQGNLGVIAPGASADLLVVDGNPLEDIGLLADPTRSIALLISRGRVHTDHLTSA
ncbi:metal-dependent hydrolase family protein [Microlunatus soli]|uniref:Imidazolonepropionase n=1 Tax=Microlunatus soli TaxID=630515 RepID=A0A1H2AI91_9ACTN|nr:amidohydrolase family protein [Microlunatus soli]SDT45693.1 Imidazolonepropionase [Microlunatus soli]